jgi:hypothetical protein
MEDLMKYSLNILWPSLKLVDGVVYIYLFVMLVEYYVYLLAASKFKVRGTDPMQDISLNLI